MCLLLSAISIWLYLDVFSLNCPPLLIKHSIDVPSTFSNLYLALPPRILLELSTFTNKTLYRCAFYFQQSLSGFTSMYSPWALLSESSSYDPPFTPGGAVPYRTGLLLVLADDASLSSFLFLNRVGIFLPLFLISGVDWPNSWRESHRRKKDHELQTQILITKYMYSPVWREGFQNLWSWTLCLEVK